MHWIILVRGWRGQAASYNWYGETGNLKLGDDKPKPLPSHRPAPGLKDGETNRLKNAFEVLHLSIESWSLHVFASLIQTRGQTGLVR